MAQTAKTFPTLELRPKLGDEPRLVVVGALLVGLALGAMALYAIFELVPELNRLFYPLPVPVVAAIFVLFVGILASVYLFHRVILSHQGVEVRWGPFRKTLKADAIEAVVYLEDRSYRTLGATGHQNTIMFGESFSGDDLERARTWLRAFAENRGIPYRALHNRKELYAVIAEYSPRKDGVRTRP